MGRPLEVLIDEHVERTTRSGPKADLGQEAAVRRGVEDELAAAAADKLPCDGEPQPAPAGVACAGVVEPGEAVEDALAVVVGNSGAVVGHCDDRSLRRTTERQVDARAGVATGVVDEVADDAFELES